MLVANSHYSKYKILMQKSWHFYSLKDGLSSLFYEVLSRWGILCHCRAGKWLSSANRFRIRVCVHNTLVFQYKYKVFKGNYPVLQFRMRDLSWHQVCFSSCLLSSGWLFGEGLVQHQQVEVWCSHTLHPPRCQCECAGGFGFFLCVPGPSSLCHWFLLEEDQQIHATVWTLSRIIFTAAKNGSDHFSLF